MPYLDNFLNHQLLAIKLPSNYQKGIGIAIIDEKNAQILEVCLLNLPRLFVNSNENAIFLAKKVRQYWEEKMTREHEPKTLCIEYTRCFDRDGVAIQQRDIISFGMYCGHIENSFQADVFYRCYRPSIDIEHREFFMNKLDEKNQNILSKALKDISPKFMQSVLGAAALGISTVEKTN